MAEAPLLRQHFPSLAAFRSSEALRQAAQELLHHSVLLPVKRRVHNHYEMGARVEALLDFLVAACCIPHVFALLGEGSNKQYKEELQAKTSYEAAQAMLQECLQFFKDAHQEYLAKGGDDEQLDASRTRLVVRVINYRRVPWIASFAGTVETHLPPLLGTMARHLLVVANLCGEVTRKIDAVTHAIRRKVSSQQEEEEDGTKQDPQEVLASHVSDFWRWLRQNRARLVPLCRVNELVGSLDQTLRNSLKAEHYTSPEQFLNTFNSRYRSALNRLPVPLLEWTQSDYEQAMKDVAREHVIVNTRRVPGAELREHLYDAMHPLVLGYLRALFAHYATAHSGNGAKKDDSGNLSPPTTLPAWSEQLEKEAAELSWRVADHMIVSSSRTVSCGDMLLLLEDLFGGEGLVLTPHGKDPVDATIQVSESGEVVMEAAEQFHLVEADQQPLQGQQLDVLMTFRTNAITHLRLNKCPRCRADVAVQVAAHDESVETKADSATVVATASSATSLAGDDGEAKADPAPNPAPAPTTPSKAANGQRRILQQACSDVFDRLVALSQRHMCVLPLLPVVGQFVVGADKSKSSSSNNSSSNSASGGDDEDDDCYDV